MDIELLIHEVFQRPVLWDTTTEEYKNKHMKTTAWGEVACALFPDMQQTTAAEQKMMRKYTGHGRVAALLRHKWRPHATPR
jgi:hypothetical protein